jgi:hypothetical protein
MNEVDQLANALLTVVFAAAMFVVGDLYIEKSLREFRPSTMPLRHSCYGRTLCNNFLDQTAHR